MKAFSKDNNMRGPNIVLAVCGAILVIGLLGAWLLLTSVSGSHASHAAPSWRAVAASQAKATALTHLPAKPAAKPDAHASHLAHIARTPAVTPSQLVQPSSQPGSASPAGYLGNVNGGGYGNPCNYASGSQLGDCNPTGQTPGQYASSPAGQTPGNGCYYVKMGEGFCPSTNTYVPMADPNL